MQLSKKQLSAGFTLIELLVASGIFAMVLLIGFGVLRSATSVQSKTGTERVVGEATRFSLETIARQLRAANGSLVLSSTGQITRVAPPFTILATGSTLATPQMAADGQTTGDRVKIVRTDLVTGTKTIRLMSLKERVLADGRIHRYVALETCEDLLCLLPVEESPLTPDSLEVARQGLVFEGLPFPSDGSAPDRQPFLRIKLAVATDPRLTQPDETAHLELTTLVTSRDYLFGR